MTNYIRHRLAVAGSEGREIFAPDTFDTIFRYTGGIPRLVNTLCDTALLAAFAEGEETVSLQTRGSCRGRTAVAGIRESHAHEPAGVNCSTTRRGRRARRWAASCYP